MTMVKFDLANFFKNANQADIEMANKLLSVPSNAIYFDFGIEDESALAWDADYRFIVEQGQTLLIEEGQTACSGSGHSRVATYNANKIVKMECDDKKTVLKALACKTPDSFELEFIDDDMDEKDLDDLTEALMALTEFVEVR